MSEPRHDQVLRPISYSMRLDLRTFSVVQYYPLRLVVSRLTTSKGNTLTFFN